MPTTTMRRPVGRPPVGPAVTYRVPEEIKEYVESEALRLGVKAADVWRELTSAEYARRLRRRTR